MPRKTKAELVYRFNKAVEKFKTTPIPWEEGRKFLRLSKDIKKIEAELKKANPDEYIIKMFVKEVNKL